MEQELDPTVQRRRLRIELRKARSDTGLSQKQVAEELGWSPSKLLRIENGQVGISRTDLKALLDLYEITDSAQIKTFVEMAQQGRRQQAWSQYRDVLYPEYMAYLSYEASASLVRQVEAFWIPGLLQTEEYARKVNRAFSTPDTTERDIERQTEARLLRQTVVLDRDDPPEMFFIIDESAVRRWVGAKPGDGRIMARQLNRLQELAANPRVSIQIVPFRKGIHFGMQGSFAMLEFPEDDELLFLENRSTNVTTREGTDVIARYKDEFYRLEDMATTREELPAFLEPLIAEMS